MSDFVFARSLRLKQPHLKKNTLENKARLALYHYKGLPSLPLFLRRSSARIMANHYTRLYGEIDLLGQRSHDSRVTDRW